MSEQTAHATTLRRPAIAMLIGLSLVSLVTIWAHLYFARRLVLESGVPEPWSWLGYALIAAGGSLLFVHPITERLLGPSVAGVLGWPAYIWMGTSFYLLLSLWFSDLALLAAGLHGVEVARTRAAAVCALALIAVLVGMRSALGPQVARRIEVALPNWPAALDGYRIVQVSDIHVGALIRAPFLRRMVERCNAVRPDLIAITGDLVDGSVEHYGNELAPLSELSARDGVYFCTGNHDHFSGANPWVARVEALGIEVLRNRRVAIARDGAVFEVAGVDDYSTSGRPGRGHDLPAALDGWDGESPLLLLAHDPRSFREAKGHGRLLQLSGHTHGGQIWPFNTLVRMQTRHLAGLYREGNASLYVSRGTGFWGPPMRLFAPAEITELVLRAA